MKTQTRQPVRARSLTAMLGIAFLALSAVVLLISSILQIFSNLQTQQAAIANQQQLIAQDAAKAVSNDIQEKFSVLETAVRLANPATVPQESQRRILAGLLGLQPAFRQLVVLNTHDQELAQISRLAPPASRRLTDHISRGLLTQSRQGKKYIGPVYVDPVTMEPLVVIAVPATDALGDFQGTLVAEVNLKFMWNLVDQLKVGKTGWAYVVNRQGDLIAFGDTVRLLQGENVQNLEKVREFMSSSAPADAMPANLITGIKGTTVVGTYVPLGTPDWAVVTELPWQEAYRQVIQVAVVSFGITLVMVVLASLVGTFLARRLVVPLVNLTETATHIADGETGLQAAVGGPSEVARLATAFNSMTAQLQQSLESLEQQVVEVKQAEESLRRANQTLQALIDYSPLAIIMLDLDSRVLLWNNAAEKMYGWTAQETLGNYIPFILEDQREEQRATSERITQGEVFTDLELEHRRKDGSRILNGISIAPLRDSTGSVYAHMSIATDITERKQAEKKFRELADLNQTILDTAGVGIIYIADRKAQWANRAFLNMFGFDQDEIFGAETSVFYANEDDYKRIGTESYPALARGEVSTTEVLKKRKDGGTFWVSLNGKAVNSGKPFEGSIWVLLDITERKQAERQLERNLREARVRFEVSQALAGKETEDEVLDVLLQQAGLYPKAHMTIFTFDKRQDELIGILRRQHTFESGLTAVMSVGDSLPGSRYTLFDSFSTNQPLVSEDVWLDERFEPAGREILGRTGTASFAAFPLKAGNELMGYIGAMAKSTGYFDEEKQHLYQTLAEQGAVALRAARLRETIRESQQRLSLFVQRSPLAVIEWDTDFKVVSWNPAAERIFGYTREEALGCHASLIVPEQARLLVDHIWQALLAQKGGTYSTNENLTKDGRLITCEWFNTPLVGADGQIIGVASLIQDITEREQAEMELLREKLFTEKLLESLPGIFFLYDSTCHLKRWNKAHETATGFSADELRDWYIPDWHETPEDAAIGMALVKSVLETGVGGAFETTLINKEGRFVPYLISITRLLTPDGPVMMGVGIDITERKRAEQVQAATYRISEAAQTTQNMDELFDSIHSIISELMPAKNFYIALYDVSTDSFNVPYMVDEFGVPPPPYKPGKGLNAYVLRTGKPLLATPEVFEKLMRSGEVELIGKAAVNWLGVPLKTQGETIGVMATYTYTEANRLDEADKDILVFVSAQVAMMIERKRVEEKFRELADLNQTILDTAGVGITYIADRKAQWANEAFLNMFGFDQDEIFGAETSVFYADEDDYKRIGTESYPALARGEVSTTEVLMKRKDGGIFWVSLNGKAVDSEKPFEGSIWVLLDITDRKRTEEALRRAHDELEERVEQRTAELRKANEQLAALYRVGQIITIPLQLKVVLDAIVRNTAELLGMDTGVILLVDEASQTLTIQGAFGLSETVVKGTCDRIGESIAGRVAQSGQPIIANDLPNNPRFYNPSAANEGLLACISVPLAAGGKIIGTLDVHSKRDRHAFNEEHIHILSLLASQAAIAIENARLYEQLQLARDELEMRVEQRTAELVAANVQLQREITERKRAEENLGQALDNLAQERTLLRTVIDNLPDAIYVKDTQGRKVLINRTDLALSGFQTEAEVLGKTDFEIYPEHIARGFDADDKQVFQTQKPLINREEIVFDSNDQIRWLLTSKLPLYDSKGNLIGLAGIGHDVTEQKNAGDALRRLNAELEDRVRERTAQLEAANKELESFSYSVSHDLRAPLRSIDGWSQILLEDYHDKLEEQGQQYIERMHSEVQRMGRLIEDMLQLSRLTRAEMIKEPVNLSALAQSIADRLQADEPLRKVDFNIQAGLTAEGDTHLLEIMLTNLLDNAFKFTCKRADARIEFGGTELQGGRVFFVRDNGAGFDMAYTQKLFGAFQRMHKVSEFPGVGVGLATVQRIIQRHGGRVWAEAEIDRGATFYFTLG